jgi:hypothetical protein
MPQIQDQRSFMLTSFKDGSSKTKLSMHEHYPLYQSRKNLLSPAAPKRYSALYSGSHGCRGHHWQACRRPHGGPHGAYCAVALLTWSGLPLKSLISLAQTFSISATTFFGIGT